MKKIIFPFALLACLLPLAGAHANPDLPDPFALGSEQTLIVSLPQLPAPQTRSFARQPLYFERNDGQTDSSVAFVSRGRGYTLFLARDEVVLKLVEPIKRNDGFPVDPLGLHSCNADFPVGEPGRLENRRYDIGTDDPSAGESRTGSPAGVLRMRLSGANPQPTIEGEDHQRAMANYFIGNQPAHWRTNIPTFGKVRYREVYPGIDLVFYGNEGQLEYDFVVGPGADPNRIAMEFEGAEELRVEPAGDLVLKVGERVVRWQKPLVYQEWNGSRREVVGTYHLGTREPHASAQDEQLHNVKFVSFTLAGYDPTIPLVIDPRLVYSTYLGGSSYDYDCDLAADGQGNVYMAGITASLDFPTKGALQGSASGGEDSIFVTKFNPAGELLFSTYLGGSGDETALNAGSREVVMALTSTGDCYVAGATGSLDFPLVNPLQASLRGKSDAFVTALKSDGSALLFSTYLGGNKWDGVNGIAIGPQDDVFIVGGTESSNFPTTNAFQPRISTATGNEGYQEPDAFITRLEAGGKSIRYSTFYGMRTRVERAWDVKVDAEGNAYVAMVGHLSSMTTDGFTDGEQWLITKLSADGRTRLFERLWPESIPPLPASQHPWTLRMALTPNGRVVIAGQINLDGVPLPAFNEPNSSIVGWNEVYVALFDAMDGNYVSAVYLGGSGGDNVARVLVDAAGDIIVAGNTSGQNLEPSGFPVTDPLESGPVPGLSWDVFVAKFRSTDLSLVTSTLVGGLGMEVTFQKGGAALDPEGNLWLASATDGQSPMVNAFQSQFGGGGDAFLAKLSFGERLQVSLSGQSVTISWPAQATDYVLEAATSLPAVSWAAVTNTPTVNATERSVQLPMTGNARFFRLRKQ